MKPPTDNQPYVTPNLKPLMTIAEVAQHLGRSKGWVYKQVALEHIKVLKTSGVTVIPARELEAFLNSTTVYRGKHSTPF